MAPFSPTWSVNIARVHCSVASGWLGSGGRSSAAPSGGLLAPPASVAAPHPAPGRAMMSQSSAGSDSTSPGVHSQQAQDSRVMIVMSTMTSDRQPYAPRIVHNYTCKAYIPHQNQAPCSLTLASFDLNKGGFGFEYNLHAQSDDIMQRGRIGLY